MTDRAHVACGSCRACCRGEAIILFPAAGDLGHTYLTRAVLNPINGEWVTALQQKENGDCVYLGDKGCTIHERAPSICQTFDCVDWYKKFMAWPRAERRRMRGMAQSDVLQAGKARARASK